MATKVYAKKLALYKAINAARTLILIPTANPNGIPCYGCSVNYDTVRMLSSVQTNFKSYLRCDCRRYQTSRMNSNIAKSFTSIPNAITTVDWNKIPQNFQQMRVNSSASNPSAQKVILEASEAAGKLGLVKEMSEMKGDGALDLRSRIEEWKTTADPYLKLMRVDKPTGTWLLFWPCGWSILMASNAAAVPLSHTSYHLALFLTGAFFMRGAGCTINDMWDKDIDGKVERTRDRPLVSGAISTKQAVAFLGVQLFAGFLVLLQLNWYSVILGASSLSLVLTYPLAKRFTNYPQVFLGATFNWGALLGWSAIMGELSVAVCAPLYAGALCWTIVYDTIYAHQDKSDDARIGIKSTALTFGAHTKPLLALSGTGALAGLTAAGLAADMGLPYYVALAAASLHVGRQIYTLDMENPKDCADKFASNKYVGLLIFLGVLGGSYKLLQAQKDGFEKRNSGTEEREEIRDGGS